MPRTLTIRAAALRYVLPHVGTEESRPNLHGVLFETSGLAVATNGHTLGVHRTAADPHAAPVVLRFHEPRKVTASKVETLAVVIPDDPTTAPVSVTLYGKLGVCHPIGVTLADMLPLEGFPMWRQVYRPRLDTIPVPSIGLDPALADRFAVAVGRQTGKLSVTFDGSHGAMLIRYPDEPDALGLWMPCTDKATGSAVEAWAAMAAHPEAAPEATPEATPEAGDALARAVVVALTDPETRTRASAAAREALAALAITAA